MITIAVGKIINKTLGYVSTMMNKDRCTKDMDLIQTILLHCGGIGFIGLVLTEIFLAVRIIISLA